MSTPLSSFDPNAKAEPGSGIYGLPTQPEEARVLLYPVPFDATTSYHRGTAKGPAAILGASTQVDLYDHDTGKPYLAGICMLEEDPEFALWNAEAGDPLAPRELANQIGEDLYERVLARSEEALHRGQIFGVIGGDHSVPLGSIVAHARKYPGMGILHIDAHADLRHQYEGFVHSHASIMNNVLSRADQVARLVQVGIRDFCEEEWAQIKESKGRIVLHHDSDLAQRQFSGESWIHTCQRITDDLPQEVYISFDIDGLDPTLCPHTGTPVPGGLSFQQVVCLLSVLTRSGRRIVGFDLCEVAPGAADDWDANVGARMLYKLIGFTLRSQ